MGTKFIFVTGGVVSGLGKGITAASLGRLLKARGLKVLNQKFDPYINIDPGLMSPTQHGEVFITEDGAETDLDIGHYERFTDENLNMESDITSGIIYDSVIQKERRGEYMGGTVQVVPHIINEIKDHIYRLSRIGDPDVIISEIGGTVGDMESLPFLEAIRQVGQQAGSENVLYVHVTLLPYMRKAGELKTKPTQHSVQKLLSIGVQPDILVCRTEIPFDHQVRQKIALYCNVEPDCVIENPDVDSVYELPILFEEAGLARAVCRKLQIAQLAQPDLRDWAVLTKKLKMPRRSVEVALVGKYVDLHDAYLSVLEAFTHAGIANETNVTIRWVQAEDVEKQGGAALLSGVDGIIIPGGFGPRGMEGMIEASRYAREQNIPFFGIGLGMQMAVVEFSRNAAGMYNAHSDECEKVCSPIFVLPEQEKRDSNAPVPIRRGSFECEIVGGTIVKEAYGTRYFQERHHNRWEFSNLYLTILESKGFILSAVSKDDDYLEAFEIGDHPWYLGVLFHPQFKSRPTRPHPLFVSYLKAVNTNKFRESL
jgi:CTP synthase